MDNDDAYDSLKEHFLRLWKMIDGYKKAIMDWNKYINDGIGEGTKKLCAWIDKKNWYFFTCGRVLCFWL